MSAEADDGPGPGPEGVLSSQVIAELRTIGGDGLVRELMEVFTGATPERLRKVEQSLVDGDLEGAAAALHSLRSASGTVGARRLFELAGRLERAAQDDGSAELAGALPELRREVEAALGAARRLGAAEEPPS